MSNIYFFLKEYRDRRISCHRITRISWRYLTSIKKITRSVYQLEAKCRFEKSKAHIAQAHLYLKLAAHEIKTAIEKEKTLRKI